MSVNIPYIECLGSETTYQLVLDLFCQQLRPYDSIEAGSRAAPTSIHQPVCAGSPKVHCLYQKTSVELVH